MVLAISIDKPSVLYSMCQSSVHFVDMAIDRELVGVWDAVGSHYIHTYIYIYTTLKTVVELVS